METAKELETNVSSNYLLTVGCCLNVMRSTARRSPHNKILLRNVIEFKNSMLYVLVEHEVWSKVKHPAVGVLIGPPPQGKHHHSHPRMLNDGHLVIHMEISKTWEGEGFGKIKYCNVSF